MLRLASPRPVPEDAIPVPLPGREDHYLRPLRPDRMTALLAAVAELAEAEPRSCLERPAYLATLGAVGLTWAHPSLALETPPPDVRRLDADALADFGSAVADELHAAGYDLGTEGGRLYAALVRGYETRRAAALRLFGEEEIRDRVDFLRSPEGWPHLVAADLGLAFGGRPGAFWTWTEEEQRDALALHRIGLAAAEDRDPADMTAEELTVARLRYCLSRPLTLNDLMTALIAVYTPKKPVDVTDDVIAEARRRRGLPER